MQPLYLGSKKKKKCPESLSSADLRPEQVCEQQASFFFP